MRTTTVQRWGFCNRQILVSGEGSPPINGLVHPSSIMLLPTPSSMYRYKAGGFATNISQVVHRPSLHPTYNPKCSSRSSSRWQWPYSPMEQSTTQSKFMVDCPFDLANLACYHSYRKCSATADESAIAAAEKHFQANRAPSSRLQTRGAHKEAALNVYWHVVRLNETEEGGDTK